MKAVSITVLENGEFLVKCEQTLPAKVHKKTTTAADSDEDTYRESTQNNEERSKRKSESSQKCEEEKSQSDIDESIHDETEPLEAQIEEPETKIVLFKTKNVILAIGGQQSVPDDIKLLGIKPKSDSFFTSDECVKREGFLRLLEYIKTNNVKEISIIGGSHSGLS